MPDPGDEQAATGGEAPAPDATETDAPRSAGSGADAGAGTSDRNDGRGEGAQSPPGGASRPTTGDDATPAGGAAGPDGDTDPSGREVVVPLRVYKTVTVMSTLLAVVAVVGGFLLLDAATLGRGVIRRTVEAALDLVGVGAAGSAVSALLALAGLGSIAAGAGVYVMGTRFRAREMGNAEEGTDGDSDDG